jgi:hypothetical protein
MGILFLHLALLGLLKTRTILMKVVVSGEIRTHNFHEYKPTAVTAT